MSQVFDGTSSIKEVATSKFNGITLVSLENGEVYLVTPHHDESSSDIVRYIGTFADPELRIPPLERGFVIDGERIFSVSSSGTSTEVTQGWRAAEFYLTHNSYVAVDTDGVMRGDGSFLNDREIYAVHHAGCTILFELTNGEFANSYENRCKAIPDISALTKLSGRRISQLHVGSDSSVYEKMYAAILDDGSVVTWGLADKNDAPHIPYELEDWLDGSVDVTKLAMSKWGIIALRTDGQVASWGSDGLNFKYGIALKEDGMPFLASDIAIPYNFMTWASDNFAAIEKDTNYLYTWRLILE
ncbi:hypothetical protein BCU68_03380 [Vibrio sp. 10N.286.49.B3]|uniref:hypothetical protein n=1 Tax=Vibrio sp. 10N.286.49.B3 TaxID=1880855 RepID=UPI000C854BF9|nr:hypothetical protein [Vibrio sp. 10N.286.49.B3]PMH44555.1 hypothetical protein BCU68_03380 [Vibrio sp. 10N.286.49.B3]